MTDWKDRLMGQLEPVLKQTDPRPAISAYHDMPYAIFRYPPEDEFAVRQEIALLRTRLEQSGKRVTSISLFGVHVRSPRNRGPWHRGPRRSREDGGARINHRDNPPGLERVPAARRARGRAHPGRRGSAARRGLHRPRRSTLPHLPHVVIARATQGEGSRAGRALLPGRA